MQVFLERSESTVTKVVMKRVQRMKPRKKKIVLRGVWDISSMKRVDQISFNINETECYEMIGKK